MAWSICGNSGANTGAVQCDRRRSTPKKIVIGGYAFSKSEQTTTSAFDAALIAAFKKATGDGSKMYPFPEITGITDKTEANKEGTLGALGPKVSFSEGKYAVEFDVVAGVSLEKRLRKFNGQQMPVFILDDSGAFWGKLDSAGKFVGCDALIYVTPHKFGDGQNGQTTKISISFVSASDTYDSAAFVGTGLTSSDMSGLLDGSLTFISNVTNVYKIAAYIKTSGAAVTLNVGDQYSAQLADATKWKATVVSTGAALTITSVVWDATLKAWTVTFDATAFGALAAGAQIKVDWVDPTTLDTAGIVGIEAAAVVVVK